MLLGDYLFSASLRGFIPAITTLSSYVTATGITYGLENGGADIWLYKGVIPTSAEMDAFAGNTRIADCLLKFNSTSPSSSATSISYTSGTTFGTIIQEGTAAWFCLGAQNQATSNKVLLFGTVGLIGSGADLILPKVNVLTNDLWLCSLTVNMTGTFAQV